jgi:hypothetical protein
VTESKIPNNRGSQNSKKQSDYKVSNSTLNDLEESQVDEDVITIVRGPKSMQRGLAN